MEPIAAEYDSSSLDSIYAYAKRLENTTLRKVCHLDAVEDSHKRKGSFGNAIEEHYFHYAINSDSNADFAEVGTELKTTPLKLKKNGEYSAKERLVIQMINYMSVVDETWETSSLQKKLHKLLLIAYQYEADLNPADFLIKLVELWDVPAEDLPVFKRDWDTVVQKIRSGRAHELSGSDTFYLEAATKSASSKVRRSQPYSDIPAKPRAWAIKPSYMTAVFNGMLDAQSIAREKGQEQLGLARLVDLRFEPYLGLTEDELARHFELVKPGKRKSKDLCARITKHILGVSEDVRIAEFEKAGIKTKTIRLKVNGVPKEDISFPVFSYMGLAERPFEESDFLGYLRQKYLFVIYHEDAGKKGMYRLAEVLFWQMPEGDLDHARECYEEMQRRVRAGHAEVSVRKSENPCCHVRPHGANKADTLPTPYGSYETKKCFWLNASYVSEQIDRVRRLKDTAVERDGCYGNGKNVQQTLIRVAELFAGVGGFRLGLDGYHDPAQPGFEMEPAGPFKTVWANQWEPPGTDGKQFAARCYRMRFGDGELVNEDINKVLDAYEAGELEIPDVDMMVGGFPCQDYSVAKPLSMAAGIEGKKGVLWWDIYRFLRLKSPRYVLLENVDRLLKSPASQRGRDFAIILSCFASLGYTVEWRVVNAADYGFPQKRRRVYIFAERDRGDRSTEEILREGVMARALPVEDGFEVRELDIPVDPYDCSQHFGLGLKQSPFLAAGAMCANRVVSAKVVAHYEGPRSVLGDVLVANEDVPASYWVPEDKLERWRYFKGGKSEPRVNKKTGFEYRYSEGAMAFPDPLDAPARTILTGEGGGSPSRTKHIIQVADGRYRRLVPDELDQLQGFPKGWTNEGMTPGNRAFCMGNALVVGVVHRIGKVIAEEARNAR